MESDIYYLKEKVKNGAEYLVTQMFFDNDKYYVSSGVYDEQRNSFFMIDNNGKIWEYNLSSGEWTARSLLGYRMNNYHMFMLNGIIYILGQDLYYANKFIKYNPIWDN